MTHLLAITTHKTFYTRIIGGLGLALFLMLALYGLLLFKTVHTIVLRNGLEAQIAVRGEVLGNLEKEYVALRSNLTAESGEVLGLQKTEPLYVHAGVTATARLDHER